MKINLLVLFSLLSIVCIGQGSALNLGHSNYQILDRLEIHTGVAAPYHLSTKEITRGEASKYAYKLDTLGIELSDQDKEDIKRVFCENNEWLVTSEFPTTLGGARELALQKLYDDSLGVHYYQSSSQAEACIADPRYTLCKKPLLKYFYQSPGNLFEVNGGYYHLRINPILNFQLAKGNGDGEDWTFHNQRGLLLRGGVDDRIYFNAALRETQSLFPIYVRDYIIKNQSLPGNGLYKGYRSSVFNSARAFDYFNGEGHIGFNITRHVGFQFGHGRNFIGNGYRSLLLSNFSQNYLYLKLNWQLGALRYQNIFAEMATLSANANPGENLLPKKYMAAHYLSFKHKNIFSVGIYEATVFNRNGETGHFELNYLNPVIFYRTVEHLVDSPDNILLGTNIEVNLLKRFQLYGQFILDEFRFDRLVLDNNGWWANKFGYQAGLKYINALGIDHLDLQVELNTVRPYTYTHEDSLGSSYSHYSQPLAHPLGANFKEYIGIMRYQPVQELILEGRVIRTNIGESTPEENWGNDIFLPNTTFVQEFGNKIGQGVAATSTLLGIDLSYEVLPNFYVDLHYFYRKKESDIASRSIDEQYMGGGIRMNISKLRMDF